ncbi:hypothetical protein [Pseudodesulfovibrio sp. zrk46]|uniref:Ppx/GppA phosphatase family protein n=1 Tax=Pseudodesulfovibrio sp. zrk46 TaxID=2725288 RepID=UPI001448E0EC|nr:hypothetical protein [Pseudodesulfovibrio sp. zrk46]QJB55074.1 hypothetical protein HFN16_01065 [Pseudodesulfovibrio sp. zrk46]
MPTSRFALVVACLLGFLFSTIASADDALVERRAAFDIGSAVIKCTVADVNIETGELVDIVDEFFRKVDFAEDMARSYDGNFSRDIMDKGMTALEEIKSKALGLKATRFAAVGGASFGEARNGKAYFATIKSELGINAHILSKQETAVISYHSARQVRGVPARNLLVWDIGGASQQMVARNREGKLAFYMDNLASVSFKNVVLSDIQGKDVNTVSSPNPMTNEQVQQALSYVRSYAKRNILPTIADRVLHGELLIYGIGGVHYYTVPELVGERSATYTRDDVRGAIARWTGKPDAAFESEYAATRLTNLILVLGYMEALDIDTVTPLEVDLTEGLLVIREFWN